MAIYGSYLDDLISVLPILLALSGAVLLLFWRIARRRPGAMTAAAVVYLSVLVYILFFIADGGADFHNLLPGRCLYMAAVYGVGSTQGLLIQFILNLILFLPWGVFAAHFSRGRLWSLPLSVLAILLMELIQSMVGRVFDADDVLANALGAALGFSAYELIYSDRRGRRALCLSLMGCMAAAVLVIGLSESRKIYGYTVVNGYPPEASSLRVEKPLSGRPVSATVYRINPADPSALAHAMAGHMGFEAEPEIHGDTAWMTAGDGRWLTACADGTWSLNWPVEDPDQASNLYSPSELQQMARERLEGMGMAGLLPGDMEEPSDGVYDLRFSLEEKDETHWRFGDIDVRMRDDGVLMEIDSRVRGFAPVAQAPCLSPAQALRRLAAYPAEGQTPGVVIREARLVHEPNVDGRYLVPCWSFVGECQGEKWDQSIWCLDYRKIP